MNPLGKLESEAALLIRDRLKLPERVLSITELHGDASYRVYYRCLLEKGKTLILMKIPKGESSVSEEITNLKEKPGELPFINIGRFLLTQGLPVPQIYGYDESSGLLFLEDFGDETLERRLRQSSPEERDRWYRKAIELLVRVQEKGMKRKDCLAHQRSFDQTLFNWEFDHFIEYGIQKRNEKNVEAGDLKSIQKGTREITSALTKITQTFTHRDYQSRNLMIHEGSLKILDFQDALLGPLPYDLVALLRDSYISLPWKLVSDLIHYYLEAREKETGERLEESPFFKIFDWVTIQRKLKDAGRFVFIDRVKKNPSFLPFIPSSLGYAREAFERQRELKKLFEVLKKYVPEFQ